MDVSSTSTTQGPMPQAQAPATEQMPVNQSASSALPTPASQPPFPPVIEQPTQILSPSNAPKSGSKAFMFSVITVVVLLLLAGGGFYMLNANTQKPEDTYIPPPVAQLTPTPPVSDMTEQNEEDIDSEVMQIDEDLNNITSASAEIDSGLNDKSTNLTP